MRKTGKYQYFIWLYRHCLGKRQLGGAPRCHLWIVNETKMFIATSINNDMEVKMHMVRLILAWKRSICLRGGCIGDNDKNEVNDSDDDSSCSETAEGRCSVAALTVCSVVYLAGYILRQVFWCWHFCQFVSCLARLTITSREMSTTFCFKSTFWRQIVSCFKYFLIT